ncbi:MAG TPA: DUF1858 domain-containing protein [Bryobacteraceae bacterium]|nr:DUF1858 domain-containing protein [Bryobacteraceae bacterium]
MPDVSITCEMELPEILSRYPGCRKVFDRYGLVGCGGPLGPRESLAFFARAHRVDEACLLAELKEAARTSVLAASSPDYQPGPGDVIYRRFFRAGILTMFTFGCMLGAINLAIMAARGQLASLDMRAVTWAHAHAQVAGWVTFFVMGFAYQAIPRFKFTTLWQPLLASRSLFVMAVALTVRTLADLWTSDPYWALAGKIAGAAEFAVVVTFAVIIARTIQKSRRPIEPYEKFLFAALGWMNAAFAFDWWIFATSTSIRGADEWVRFISLYDAPWRDLQLAGFAGGMILGVSQRFLPFIYGFREISPRRSRVIFYLWNLAVAGSVVGYSMLIRTGDPLWALLFELCILAMFTAVALLVRGFGLFSVRVDRDRSLPFLRAAYFWAMVALGLLFLMPVYDIATGIGFSHAYFGGYRHAFTVGFISMMILGVSSKVVPALGGIDPRRLSSLRLTFWLVNIGNAMRVFFQILTDTRQWAYPWMGLSAWVEVSGLVLWAIDLWRAMGRSPEAAAAPGRVAIAPNTKVFDVIHGYPETLPIFRAYGFALIDSPIAQHVFARSISLEQACRLKHVDFAAFQATLKETVASTCTNPPSLIRIGSTHKRSAAGNTR